MKAMNFFGAALVFMAAVACNKEEEPTYTPTGADAVQVIEESLAENSGGMSEEIATLGGSMQAKDGEFELECGIPLDTTFTYVLSGSASGLWTRNWNLLMNCPDMGAPFINVNTSYTGSFDGILRSSDRQGTRNWVWTEIGPEGEFRYMNGTGDHSGMRTFNGNQDSTFGWDYDAEWTEVAILKETDQIESGTGTFTLVLTGPESNVFTFDGGVVFNGGQSATVTINGEVYEIELD